MLGDIIPTDFLLADMVRGCARYSMLGVNEADDPTQCAVVEMDGKDWYLDHKEKPENPKSNKTLSGCFYFKDASTFYELQHSLMLNKIQSNRGEYDILDTIKQMFRYGESFRCIGNAVLDCGSFEGIAEAEDQGYFAKMKIMLTGSSGYIGSKIHAALRAKGNIEVFTFDEFGDKGRDGSNGLCVNLIRISTG